MAKCSLPIVHTELYSDEAWKILSQTFAQFKCYLDVRVGMLSKNHATVNQHSLIVFLGKCTIFRDNNNEVCFKAPTSTIVWVDTPNHFKRVDVGTYQWFNDLKNSPNSTFLSLLASNVLNDNNAISNFSKERLSRLMVLKNYFLGINSAKSQSTLDSLKKWPLNPIEIAANAMLKDEVSAVRRKRQEEINQIENETRRMIDNYVTKMEAECRQKIELVRKKYNREIAAIKKSAAVD